LPPAADFALVFENFLASHIKGVCSDFIGLVAGVVRIAVTAFSCAIVTHVITVAEVCTWFAVICVHVTDLEVNSFD
jgi:hypothetical protein